MVRLNLKLNEVTFVKESLIWCIKKRFYLKNPKKWTNLEQIKLIKAL